MKLSPGEKLGVKHYVLGISVPGKATLLLLGTQVWAQRREPIRTDGVTYNALVVAEYSDDGSTDITRWQSENGEIIRQEAPADRMTWIRETREKATRLDDVRGPLLDTRTKAAKVVGRPPCSLDYWMGVVLRFKQNRIFARYRQTG